MPDQPHYLNIPLVRSSSSAPVRFLVADFLFLPSDHFSESLRQSCTSTLFITIFPSPCTFSRRLLFFLCTPSRLSVCVSSASLPCLTGFPVTSSTGYFFTGPLFPLATLSSCDLHCGVPEISAPFVISLYDRTSPASCP